MKITHKKVEFQNDFELFARIKSLADEVFPPNELLAPTTFSDYEKDFCLLAFFDKELRDDDFIGFCALVPFKDIVYLAFFVVAPNHQQKGYGTAILAELKKIFSHKKAIILEAEKVCEHSPNNNERIKRAKFYEKSGFKNTKHSLSYFDETYDIYATNADFLPQFLEVFENFAKSKNFTYIYK